MQIPTGMLLESVRAPAHDVRAVRDGRRRLGGLRDGRGGRRTGGRTRADRSRLRGRADGVAGDDLALVSAGAVRKAELDGLRRRRCRGAVRDHAARGGRRHHRLARRVLAHGRGHPGIRGDDLRDGAGRATGPGRRERARVVRRDARWRQGGVRQPPALACVCDPVRELRHDPRHRRAVGRSVPERRPWPAGRGARQRAVRHQSRDAGRCARLRRPRTQARLTQARHRRRQRGVGRGAGGPRAMARHRTLARDSRCSSCSR